MKHHKYYNTIWSERDQEFYWDGLKNGTVIGAIGIATVIAYGAIIVSEIREHRRQKLKKYPWHN